MDNHFVPNLTFGPPVVKALRKVSKKLFFDAHLMVDDPLSLLDDFAGAGVQNMTIHEETCREGLEPALKAIKGAKMRAGVCIKPNTPVSAITDVLPLVDLVLVMTVEPGFGGQQLIPSCLNKIHALKRARERGKHRFCIEADGGINVKTTGLVVAAGAEILVAGSAVFSGSSVSENINAMREAIRTAATE